MVATRKTPKAEIDDIENAEEDIVKSVAKGPPPSQPSYSRKFLVCSKGTVAGSKVYLIRHPKFRTPVLYRIGKSVCDEVISCGDEYRSWFYGNSVISDGALRVCSPIHPFFIALPYFVGKKERFEVLDEIVQDSEVPAIARLAENEVFLRCLKTVADFKEIGDEIVYRYSEEKTLSWLEGRFAKLRDALKEHANLHAGITDNQEVMDRYTFAILCEYVPDTVTPQLKELLKIVDAPVEMERIDQSYKRKAADDEGEFAMDKPIIKKTKESVARKQLKAASKGTKNISSFFAKKS